MQPATFLRDQEKEIVEVVENQISTMEHCFISLFCTDEQKVAPATYKLGKYATIWWENYMETQDDT